MVLDNKSRPISPKKLSGPGVTYFFQLVCHCSSKHYSSSSTPIESPAVFSVKRCQAWFREYSEEDKLLGPEGMEKFCEDIGVEPENIVMLVVAWKLEAEQMGFFTLEEWMKGMTKLQ